MIDIKGTIDANNITAYRLAKLINRPPSQIYDWIRKGTNVSPLMEETIAQVLSDNSLDVIRK